MTIETDLDTTLPVGLQRAFSMGEQFAWKGIWFQVTQVDPGRLVLEPTTETAAHAKKRLGRKEA